MSTLVDAGPGRLDDRHMRSTWAMADTQLWRIIQSWMDGQIVRVNQSQLADAIGVNRQSLSQWKQGQARPNPDNLRALRRVTRIDWALLTDALLRDMGYVEEEHSAATTRRAGGSPAAESEAIGDIALGNLPPDVQEAARRVREDLRPDDDNELRFDSEDQRYRY